MIIDYIDNSTWLDDLGEKRKKTMGSRENRENPYADILDLPHHVSSRHQRMAMSDRAAQFSPFAALSGYGDAVREAEREYTEQAEGEIEHISLEDSFREDTFTA